MAETEEKAGEDFIRPKGAGRENGREERWIGTEEIDAILRKNTNANRRESGKPGREGWKRAKGNSENQTQSGTRVYRPQPRKEQYLLVDGYNIIFAWPELKELAQVNLDGARGKLLDILCNYQAVRKCSLIAVFDAYRIAGHPTETLKYHNIYVVYTKEAETADRYIERFAHENSSRYDVTVATSDGLEQIIIRGEGCRLLSARDLQEEIELAGQRLREEFLDTPKEGRNYLFDGLDDETRRQLLPTLPEQIDDLDHPQ